MTSFAYWLVVVDNTFRDIAAAWTLLTPNFSCGRLVLALGEDVKNVICRTGLVPAKLLPAGFDSPMAKAFTETYELAKC